MSTPSAKQGLLSLQIKDKKELYSAYMPYVKGGAIFVPTPKRYQLGDEVFLMVSFLEDKSRLPVVSMRCHRNMVSCVRGSAKVR